MRVREGVKGERNKRICGCGNQEGNGTDDGKYGEERARTLGTLDIYILSFTL